MTTDLNAFRKQRAGNADTGLCPCGEYLRLLCRSVCLETGDRRE